MVSLLVAAVPAIYLTALKDPQRGYSKAHPGKMLQLLIQRHGQITSQKLKTSLERFKAPWNPNNMITALFHYATECQQLARDGGEPIPDGQCKQILLDTIKASGVLSMAVYQWEHLPKTQQTITHLEDYFTAEDTPSIRPRQHHS